MKKKWKKHLITFLLLSIAVIALVEFQNWMKRQAEPCVDGTCPLLRGHGLLINPFPDEIIPQGTTSNQMNPGVENE